MTDLENELRQLFEHKGQDVPEAGPPTDRLVWRVRIARATAPAWIAIVLAATVGGASTVKFGMGRAGTPAPAGGDEGRRAAGRLPREEYSLPDVPSYPARSRPGLWSA